MTAVVQREQSTTMGSFGNSVIVSHRGSQTGTEAQGGGRGTQGRGQGGGDGWTSLSPPHRGTLSFTEPTSRILTHHSMQLGESSGFLLEPSGAHSRTVTPLPSQYITVSSHLSPQGPIGVEEGADGTPMDTEDAFEGVGLVDDLDLHLPSASSSSSSTLSPVVSPLDNNFSASYHGDPYSR